MTAHRMTIVTDSGDRVVKTTLPLGAHRSDHLTCGFCATVLAHGHAPMQPPAPLLRCPRCRSLNDPARTR